MKSSIFAFVAFGLLLTFVQCKSHKSVSEYVIKQGIPTSFFVFGFFNYYDEFQVFLVEVVVMKLQAKRMLHYDLQFEMNFSILAKNSSYYKMAKNVI